jgi:hypothetical protein
VQHPINCINQKNKTMKFFKIVCKETGSVIETFATYDEAQSGLSEFEYQDSNNGIFVEDFYEII